MLGSHVGAAGDGRYRDRGADVRIARARVGARSVHPFGGPRRSSRDHLVLNDAGERLSRFFVSQFSVNLGVGAMLWLGLALIGVPHAMLWAALAAALRFVPYVGVWIAAVISAVLAAAVDPGWTLVLPTFGLFAVVELIAGQLVEPQLYGHSTGLSPLSVVVAAIFWSWIWGPVGLVAVDALDPVSGGDGPSRQGAAVAGHHARRQPGAHHARALLSARTVGRLRGAHRECTRLPQARFARGLQRFVLMPALRLAAFDLERRTITREQQLKVRQTIVTVIAAISGGRRRFTRRRHAMSMLEQMNAGRQLRQQREQLIGRWQGPRPCRPARSCSA